MGYQESQYSYWMMKAHPEWTVLNKGANGQRTDQILERFEKDVISENAAVIIILAGVNDIYQARSALSIERNLDSMYALAKAKDIVVVAATILPYNTAGPEESAAITEVNSWIEKSAKASGRLFCDTNLAVRDKKDPRRLASSPDELHPDVEGYKRMGESITKTLEQAIRDGKLAAHGRPPSH